MKRPATKIVLAAVVLGALAIGVAGAMRAAKDDAPCGAGFERVGMRCFPEKSNGVCSPPPRTLVRVPKTKVVIGPSDWEAEGRVKPRTVEAGPFDIDAFEFALGDLGSHLPGDGTPTDGCRAASRIDLSEARAFCKDRGGRLPTEDEWIVAAAGDRPRRYPWGDTGAVCRRAAWGLVRGPCGRGAEGPDTVGSHPDGKTPLGIHDLAGNVAEWVETGVCTGALGGECIGVVRGGSYETDLATDLRTWVRREVSWASKDPAIGFRCAYDVAVK